MEHVNLPKRLYYRYLGTMYWLIHWTDTHRVLGIKASSSIRLLSLLPLLLAWVQGWNRAGVILALLFFLWVQFSYWRGRRNGYYRFIRADVELLSTNEITPLPKNQQVAVTATGIFSLKDWESNVVLKPAAYWQVPLGDHALMVQHEPGRFLYQFFNAESLQHMQKGWLLFGARLSPALSISFLSSWGPEFSDDEFSLRGNSKKRAAEKVRNIYLSFENEEQEEAVWNNLLFDARRVRLEQG